MPEPARIAAAPAAGADALPPQSPWRVFWRQFQRSPLALAGGALLAVFYVTALFAPFLAPYAQESMDRDRFFHPPHHVHWIDAGGRFHPLGFIHPTRLADPATLRWEEDRSQVVPVRLLVRGERYRLL